MRLCSPRFLLALLLLSTSASAQQKESTATDRLAASLGNCIGLLEVRNDQTSDLRKQLDVALAEIKVLKEKPNAK